MKYKVTDDCIGCESCVGECPKTAIIAFDGKCQIAAPKCDGCAKCVEVCPVNAVVQT